MSVYRISPAVLTDARGYSEINWAQIKQHVDEVVLATGYRHTNDVGAYTAVRTIADVRFSVYDHHLLPATNEDWLAALCLATLLA